jgi:hypothetical protein
VAGTRGGGRDVLEVIDDCDGRGLLEVIGSRGDNGTVEGSKSRTGFESVGESMVAEDDKCRGRVMKGPCQFNKNLVKGVNRMATRGSPTTLGCLWNGGLLRGTIRRQHAQVTLRVSPCPCVKSCQV